jgi:serine protease Do
VYIQSVASGSAADQGGLQRGDIITAVGNDVISADTSYINALNHHKVGEQVTLTYWRDGRTLTTEVTLGGRSQ